MKRSEFLLQAGTLAAGTAFLPSFTTRHKKVKNVGLQLYTFRKEMLADATGTLKQIAALGIKQIESAGSERQRQLLWPYPKGDEKGLCRFRHDTPQRPCTYK